MIRDVFKNLIFKNKDLLNTVSRGCFDDSVRCFDAGIYRQAYILAYQGFTQHLRCLLLNADMPTGYDDGKWISIQKKLKDEKEFDNQVFSCIQHKNQPTATPPIIAVLDIPDEVRDDFIFWRNRRNDSAHYKSYDINQSHVLAFYSLLNQYLFKISVEGGMIRLINEFKDILDERKTSPHESLQSLIDKILLMVRADEMESFFIALHSVFSNINEKRYFSMLNDILNGTNQQLKEYLILFLKDNDQLLDLLIYYPQNVGHLVSSDEARQFWYTKLAPVRERLPIIANMLKVGLITHCDVCECIKRNIEQIFDKCESFGNISDEDMNVLMNNGFVQALVSTKMSPKYTSKYARQCGQNHYEFMNAIAYQLPVNQDTVKMVLDVFKQVDYPRVWASIYKKAVVDDSEKGKIFNKTCNDNGWEIPSCIKRT